MTEMLSKSVMQYFDPKYAIGFDRLMGSVRSHGQTGLAGSIKSPGIFSRSSRLRQSLILHFIPNISSPMASDKPF